MGFIRGFFLVFVCVLLFISLIFTGILGTLNKSLDYEIVKQEVGFVIKEMLNEKLNLSLSYEDEKSINKTCLNNSEYVFEDETSKTIFRIPCQIAMQGSEAIINYEIDLLVYENYYKEYNCGFWDCFEKTQSPMFLMSKKSKDYWQDKFLILLLASAILIFFIFLLASKKSNLPIISGALLIISSLVISQLDGIGKIISKIIPLSINSGEAYREIIDKAISLFFFKANFVFWIMFILGILLILSGIAWKIFAKKKEKEEDK